MSRMPSTSTGTCERARRSPAAAASISIRSGLPRRRQDERAGRPAPRTAPARAAGRSPAARARRAPRRARCSTRSARSSRTGSVTTACASSWSTHLGERAAPTRPRARAARTPGARSAQIARRAAGTSQRLAVPTMPKRRVARPAAPAARRASSWISSSSRRMRRARASTTCPDSVGGRPAAAPGEQRHAELGLELADLVRDVRLDRPERVGGRGEGALLVDGDQRVQMAQLHRASLRRSPRGTVRPLQLPIGNSDRYLSSYLLDRSAVQGACMERRTNRGAGTPRRLPDPTLSRRQRRPPGPTEPRGTSGCRDASPT